MIQQFIHFNLWFSYVCLDQIKYIHIKKNDRKMGKNISVIRPWYKIKIFQLHLLN
jgi:hypothetical protein